jgi:hypothetical protein
LSDRGAHSESTNSGLDDPDTVEIPTIIDNDVDEDNRPTVRIRRQMPTERVLDDVLRRHRRPCVIVVT